MSNKGFTLIELIVVVTVLAVLVVALGIEYIGWQGRYKVESQIKDIYSDVVEARVRAMRLKRTHFISLVNSTTYTMYDDDHDATSAEVPDGDTFLQPADDTEIPSFPKTVEYDILWGVDADEDGVVDPAVGYVDIAAVTNLGFNKRGLAINNTVITSTGSIAISVDRDADGVKDFNPDYDCIFISATRINLGQIDTNDTPVRTDDVCVQK